MGRTPVKIDQIGAALSCQKADRRLWAALIPLIIARFSRVYQGGLMTANVA